MRGGNGFQLGNDPRYGAAKIKVKYPTPVLTRILLAMGITLMVVMAVLAVAALTYRRPDANELFHSEIVAVQDSMTALSADLVGATEYRPGPIYDGVAVFAQYVPAAPSANEIESWLPMDSLPMDSNWPLFSLDGTPAMSNVDMYWAKIQRGDTGAYWVKDEIVYAVNEIARSWSPGVDYAPTRDSPFFESCQSVESRDEYDIWLLANGQITRLTR